MAHPRRRGRAECVDERRLETMVYDLKHVTDGLIEQDAQGNPIHAALLQELVNGVIEPCARSRIELKCNIDPMSDCTSKILQLVHKLWVTPVEEGGWGRNFPDGFLVPGATFYMLMNELLMPVDQFYQYKSLHYLLLRNIVLNMDAYKKDYGSNFLKPLLFMVLEENAITGIYAMPPRKTRSPRGPTRELRDDKEAHDIIRAWINADPVRPQLYLDQHRGTPGTGITISNTIVHDMLGEPPQGGKRKRRRTKRRRGKRKGKRAIRRTRK